MLPSYSSTQLRHILIPDNKLSILSSKKYKPNCSLYPDNYNSKNFLFYKYINRKNKTINIKLGKAMNTSIKTHSVPFIMSMCMAAFLHIKPASTRTYHDSRRVQGCDERNVLCSEGKKSLHVATCGPR